MPIWLPNIMLRPIPMPIMPDMPDMPPKRPELPIPPMPLMPPEDDWPKALEEPARAPAVVWPIVVLPVMNRLNPPPV
jgi:hypothetical protein